MGNYKRKRIIVGITGSSGVIYGIEILKELAKRDWETHLIISESGKRNITLETEYQVEDVESMANRIYTNDDLEAPPASGSFLTTGMIVAPCTIKTLSAIAKVLLVREAPLHKGHLRLMTMAADMGAHILPPIPSFYHHPKTIDDIIHQTVGKVFDYFGIEHELYARWGEER